MKTKYTYMTYVWLILFCTLMVSVSCTDVEWCGEDEPHMGNLVFTETDDNVEVLYVVAERIVNHKMYLIAHNMKTGTGEYLYNRPEMISEEDNHDLSIYPIGEGEYRISILNSEGGIDELLNDYLTQNKTVSSFTANMQTYKRTDDEFADILGTEINLSEWKDYNNYSNYVMPCKSSVVSGLIQRMKVPVRVVTECPTVSNIRSAQFNFSININKRFNGEPFVVEKVVAEMSGVPKSIETFTGEIDIADTYKSIFQMQVSEDNYSKGSVTCKSVQEFLTIVPPKSPSVSTGEGIMQLMIYVTTQSGVRKVMQAKINLYNTIKRENYIIIDNIEQVARNKRAKISFNIASPITISSESITATPGSSANIDEWQSMGDPIIIESDRW